MRPDYDVIVAGAGIVGSSAALWAQKRGLRVLLCDPRPPGSGASYGNACTLATYACLPVNNPSVLRQLPWLMTSPESPLSISWGYALTRLGWMVQFLRNCTEARSTAIARDLAELLAHADAGLDPLIAEAGAEDLIHARDVLYVWTTEAGYRADQAGNRLRSQLGVPATELDATEIARLEPHLRLRPVRGLRFQGARHVHDPQALITRMVARFQALGGHWQQVAAESVRHSPDQVMVRLNGVEVTAGHLVVAMGAHSRDLRGGGAENLPLGTERGYHLLYRDHAHRLSRPVGWAEGGFYAVPMAQGLRLAGTVEIAALRAPPNKRRLAYIARKGAEMFGPLDGPTEAWLGFRPTLPDSRPVIGRSTVSPRILHAFGHQHLGLTLGGITGRIIADLAEGRAPNLPLAAFAADRF